MSLHSLKLSGAANDRAASTLPFRANARHRTLELER